LVFSTARLLSDALSQTFKVVDYYQIHQPETYKSSCFKTKFSVQEFWGAVMRDQNSIESANVNIRVTCIIIFLNEETYLTDAIHSVLAQTYDKWELLLVDDGSTDQSSVIAYEYSQKYPDRIQYLTHSERQNRGMSASRNLGLRHARGEYIAFLDGDDIWLPQKLAEQISILETYSDAAMVYGRVQLWYSWTGDPKDQNRDSFAGLGVTPNRLLHPPELLRLLLSDKVQKPTTFAMVRRQVFDQFGYFEDSARGLFEDIFFFTKIAANASVYVSDQQWGKYRQHLKSCCHTTSAEAYCAKGLILMDWIESYLLNCGIEDPLTWKMLHRKQFLYRYPNLYFLLKEGVWSRVLTGVMQLGRKVLPQYYRDWLWKIVGHRLWANALR
jgi:glycosyltransferase involved in cell wall biosynthesis